MRDLEIIEMKSVDGGGTGWDAILSNQKCDSTCNDLDHWTIAGAGYENAYHTPVYYK